MRVVENYVSTWCLLHVCKIVHERRGISSKCIWHSTCSWSETSCSCVSTMVSSVNCWNLIARNFTFALIFGCSEPSRSLCKNLISWFNWSVSEKECIAFDVTSATLCSFNKLCGRRVVSLVSKSRSCQILMTPKALGRISFLNGVLLPIIIAHGLKCYAQICKSNWVLTTIIKTLDPKF